LNALLEGSQEMALALTKTGNIATVYSSVPAPKDTGPTVEWLVRNLATRFDFVGRADSPLYERRTIIIAEAGAATVLFNTPEWKHSAHSGKQVGGVYHIQRRTRWLVHHRPRQRGQAQLHHPHR
jgi:hypothetical protein